MQQDQLAAGWLAQGSCLPLHGVHMGLYVHDQPHALPSSYPEGHVSKLSQPLLLLRGTVHAE